MNKLLKTALLLATVLILMLLAACGGDGASSDPNVGVYVGETANIMGIEMDIDDIWSGGLSIELMDGGKCRFTVDGASQKGAWTLDGDAFHAESADVSVDGTLGNGEMYLVNMLDTGADIILINHDYQAPSAEGGEETAEGGAAASGDDAGRYEIISYEVDGNVTTREGLIAADAGDIYLVLNEDGTGTLCLLGTETDITWTPGVITIFETSEYTYTRDGNLLIMDMQGPIYTMALEGSPELEAAE